MVLIPFTLRINLLHRPGKVASKPDALSRRADHVPTGVDNDNIVLLKSKWFGRIAVMRGQIEVEGVGNELMEAIRKGRLTRRTSFAGTWQKESTLTKERNVLLYKGLVYVPPTPELRTKVIEAHHNTPLAGHPGMLRRSSSLTATIGGRR